MALIETLEWALEYAKVSQSELARRLKRPQSYVSDMLAGKKTKYDLFDIEDWATALDMEPIVLLAVYFTRSARRP
jgi:transcriptional regulator with XRE-family HTH domain